MASGVRNRAPRPRPNILLIQADQLRASALSFHGNKVSKTPNIDRLMNDGVVFSNAYCNSPLCSPSRFSMMTGLLPTEIGAWDNAAQFSSDIPTYAHALRLQGYHTVLAGKMHFVGPDQLHGFEERLTTDVYPADFGWTPNWDEEAKGGRNPLFFETFVSVAEADWVHSSMQLDFDEDVAHRTKRKLREMGRKRIKREHSGGGDDRPFFIHASFTQPHDPYSGPKQYWDQYEGIEIDMPSVSFIPREDRDTHSKRVYDCMDAGDYDMTKERIIKARRAYYSMMSYIDSKVGEFLSTLEEENLMDDTMIIFTADHGDMQGERGMWFKETYHEDATRVPLFFSATPAMCKKFGLGSMVPGIRTQNVSLVDLMPTLVHLASLESDWRDCIPTPLDGQSLVPSICWGDDCASVQKCHTIYCEYTAEMIPGGWFMVKQDDLKFIYSEHEPLLFDLKQDPKEMVNVAGQAAYKDRLSELMKLAKARWPNIASLAQHITRSQRNRRMIHASLMKGKRKYWDFETTEDAASMYIRNTGEKLQDQEYVCRTPYRGKRPCR